MKYVIKIVVLTILFTGCAKENIEENTSQDVNETLSLKAFVESRLDDIEGGVYENLEIIDNTEKYIRFFASSEERTSTVIGFPKWGQLWYVGGCLPTGVGSCIIMPNPIENPLDPLFGHFSVLSLVDDGLLVEPQTALNGFTEDGYLPIPQAMPIDPYFCSELGISAGSHISPGIYAVNSDGEGAYTSVLLNIEE